MDPKLLDLPLGIKIPVPPTSKPVFFREKLGEKIHRPFPYFHLDDPYCYQLSTKYNCLHDPTLEKFHKRKDVLQLLKRQGFITSDNKVVCTLKEFNEYRQYLTRLKLESEKTLKRQEERTLAKLRHGPRLLGATNFSQAKRQLKTQKPSCPSLWKSRETSLKSKECRSVRSALDKEDAKPPVRVRTNSDVAADGLLKAVFEQLTAAEAQKLEEMAENVVRRVLERLKIPGDQNVSSLRRDARESRGCFGSCMKVELLESSPDHRCQEIEAATKALVVAALEILRERLASSLSKASEPGLAARWKEQPVDRGATQADKSKANEIAVLDRAPSQAPSDKFTREIVESVHCTLKSSVGSQFEEDSSCKYKKSLELPGGNVSTRQLQPGLPRASEQLSMEGSTGAKLPAEGTGYARIMEPKVLVTAKENLEREMNLESIVFANALEIRIMANQIADLVLEQISRPRPAPRAPGQRELRAQSTE